MYNSQCKVEAPRDGLVITTSYIGVACLPGLPEVPNCPDHHESSGLGQIRPKDGTSGPGPWIRVIQINNDVAMGGIPHADTDTSYVSLQLDAREET